MIADLLLKKEKIRNSNFDEWKRLFTYGVLLPDAVHKEQKRFSHFWKQSDLGKVVVVPDLEAFTNKYKVSLSEPLEYGYMAHLHLDKFFFEQYFKENVVFLNRAGNPEEYLQEVQSVLIKKNNQTVGLSRLFSEEYLYGDYTKLNQSLIERYKLKIPIYQKNIHNSIEEVNYEDIQQVLGKLNSFIEMSDNKQRELKVFPENTLENFLWETAEKFINGGYVK